MNDHQKAKLVVTICLIVLAAAVITLGGCATYTDDEADQRAYNRQASFENWALCDAIMEANNVPQAIHNHAHKKRQRLLLWMVREDLARNSCRLRLGGLWIERQDDD